MADQWGTHGLVAGTHGRPVVQHSKAWEAHGRPTGNSWVAHGKPLGDPWDTHATPMGQHNRHMGTTWVTLGKTVHPVGGPWQTCGTALQPIGGPWAGTTTHESTDRADQLTLAWSYSSSFRGKYIDICKSYMSYHMFTGCGLPGTIIYLVHFLYTFAEFEPWKYRCRSLSRWVSCKKSYST